VNVGVAAYITAASPGGPRYDPALTTDQRSGGENAIWLCQTCGKLVEKPVSERERRKDELARLIGRYDRSALYEQVWSQPVQDVAKSVSGVRLANVCRTLHVPVPPRGYWARVRSGCTVRKPSLPNLK
jgi:hypothetical protein